MDVSTKLDKLDEGALTRLTRVMLEVVLATCEAKVNTTLVQTQAESVQITAEAANTQLLEKLLWDEPRDEVPSLDKRFQPWLNQFIHKIDLVNDLLQKTNFHADQIMLELIGNARQPLNPTTVRKLEPHFLAVIELMKTLHQFVSSELSNKSQRLCDELEELIEWTRHFYNKNWRCEESYAFTLSLLNMVSENVHNLNKLTNKIVSIGGSLDAVAHKMLPIQVIIERISD